MTHAPAACVEIRPKRGRRDDGDRKQICLYARKHGKTRQEDIALAFGVERSTVSKILKAEDKWLNIGSDSAPNKQSLKGRPPKYPEIECEMLASLHGWSDKGMIISDSLIRNRSLEIAKAHQIPLERFRGSPGWIDRFKRRHNIRRGEWLNAEKRPLRIVNTTTPLANPQHFPTLSPLSPLKATPVHNGPTPLQHTKAQNILSREHPHPAPLVRSLSPEAVHSGSCGQSCYDVQDVEKTLTPTLEAAELALNTVITFILNCEEDLISDDDRDCLRNVKFALFHYSNGVPFERSYQH